MNVMKKAHQATRAMIANNVSGSYANLFKMALIQAHKDFKKWSSEITNRVTTVDFVTGETVTKEFTDSQTGDQIEYEHECKRAAKYSRILVEWVFNGEWASYNDRTYTAEQLASQRKLNTRIEDEKRVVKKIVERAIRTGYMVSLYDGEEFTVKRSTDKQAILDAIYTTDMDKLVFRSVATGEQVGAVLLVYGNSASEVMNDWHDSAIMNDILADATEYCRKLEAKGL